MSQRGKRGTHLHHPRLDVEPQPPPTKRRKGRPPNSGGGSGGGTAVISSNEALASISTGGSGGGPGPGPPTYNPSYLVGANNSCNSSALISSNTTTNTATNPQIDIDNPAAHVASTNAGGVGEEAMCSTSAKAVGLQGGCSSSSAAAWQARSVSDIKMSTIYNRSSTEAPAELYRKDLISAMKLPDSEQLANYEYLVVNDQWKQEWERGVQVPVNPDSLPEPYVEVLTEPIVPPAHDFKLPKNRFLRITKDDTYSPELHCLTNVVALAENSCAYDIDQVDESWLKLYNVDRAKYGAPFAISETQFERVIEELEVRCWEQIQVILKNEEGLGIEYDENVICDVCRSPDSEEANEMVFCDNCNICVHQACYGITAIPSGQWLCRTCSMGIKPDCVLCPNKGGAMKSNKSGKHWAHVSCALWIPEVSIGCVDRMEPITKISSIPPSRWSLKCVLCRVQVGACIQCSVKTCKTAYHVTCAFQHGLEMRAIIEEGNAEDGVKLRSYCHKHSVSKGKKEANNRSSTSTNCRNKRGKSNGSGTEDDDCRRRKSRKSDMTSEERNQVRARRLQEVESEFDKHVNIKDISCHLFDVDDEAIEAIYNYWKLKRKSRHNRALIPPKSEDVEMIARKQEQQDIENHKLVVHLRQDLERVRNLCYMVSRREKLSRSLFKLREQVFYKQISVLTDDSLRHEHETQSSSSSSTLRDEQFKNAVIYANDGPTLYDRFYTSCDRSKNTQYQSLEYILEKLLGNVNKNGPKSANKSTHSRASTSPTKRMSKTSSGGASAASGAQQQTTTATKSPANKRVNNGAMTMAKSTTAAALTLSNDNDNLPAEKLTPAKVSAATVVSTSKRRSSSGIEKLAKSSAAPTAGQTFPVPGQRSRTSNTRTPPKTTTKTATKSSDESSSSSGSSSSEDEDSSSDNGSSSGSDSSSGSASGSSSTDTASSSSCQKSTKAVDKSSPKKIAATTTTATKRESYTRSLEMKNKQRRKSTAEPMVEQESKAKTTSSHKNDIATVLSSSSDIENETPVAAAATDVKRTKSSSAAASSVPVNKSHQPQQQSKNTSGPIHTPTASTTISSSSKSTSQASSRRSLKDNSSSDESLELLPKKNRKPSMFDESNRSNTRKAIEQIYSDTDSSLDSDAKDKEEERTAESNVSDSQNQQTIRTKAAMKEFTLQQQTCNKAQKDSSTAAAKYAKTASSSTATVKGKEKSSSTTTETSKRSAANSANKEKHHKFPADLLVVPQRQAAKKASENMRSTGGAVAVLATSSNNSNTSSQTRDVENVKQSRDLSGGKYRENLKADEKSDRFEKPEKSRSSTAAKASAEASATNEKPSANKRGRPPKNLKENSSSISSNVDTSHSATAAAMANQISQAAVNSSSRTKEQQSAPSQQQEVESKKSVSSEQQNSVKAAANEKSSQNLSEAGESSRQKTPSSETNKNNILVAYVPQRQAAKKAAEQLKNSNKPLTAAPSDMPVTPTDNDKERSSSSSNNNQEKETKLKTPESRSTKSSASIASTLPARRMSTRDNSNSVAAGNKEKTDSTIMAAPATAATPSLATTPTTEITPTTPTKTPSSSSRRRSKDTDNNNISATVTPTPPTTNINTTPKRALTSSDKKRKVSITSSSASDTSSSSSSSDGSEDSSSNSDSSCTSSSSDDDASDVEAKNETTRLAAVAAATPVTTTTTANANKRNLRKSDDSRTIVAVVAAASVTPSQQKSPKVSPQKQLRRNTSTTSNSSLANSDELPADYNRSSIQTRRKSALLEERSQKSQELKKLTDMLEAQQLAASPNEDLSPFKSSLSSPLHSANKSLAKLSHTDVKQLHAPSEEKIVPPMEPMDVATTTTPEKCSKNVEKEMPKHTHNIEMLEDGEIASKSPDKQAQNKNDLEKVEMPTTAALDDDYNANNSHARHISLEKSVSDECSEVPMDIDEELTTAPTNSALPSGRERSPEKIDDLLVDLDDRPPAAPMPASPIASSSSSSSSSSASSNDEDNELSNASDDNQQPSNKQTIRNIRKTRSRRRRTRPGSPPMSAEEEHTHHTQHLLNEMELVRALEEERKNELAAAANASSSSPAVAVIAPEPPEIIELDSNSNSGELVLARSQKQPEISNSPEQRLKTSLNQEGSNSSQMHKESHTSGSTNVTATNVALLNHTANVASMGIETTSSNNNSAHNTQAIAAVTTTTPTTASSLESAHHPIVDTILDLEDNAQQQKEQEKRQHLSFSANDLLHSSAYGNHASHAESLSNLLSGDPGSLGKELGGGTQQESSQATMSLLEKLRKTKRNRNDEPKEPDLMLPPPTPAIPSVFQFHNAADPEDIIHVQKENAMAAAAAAALENNRKSHYTSDVNATQASGAVSTANTNMLDSSPNNLNKDSTIGNLFGSISQATPDVVTNSASISSTLNYLEATGHAMQTQTGQQSQMPISPMQQQQQHTPTHHHAAHAATTPNSSYSQQAHTPTQQQQQQQQQQNSDDVAELTSLIQKELASQTTSVTLNKALSMDSFGQKQQQQQQHNNRMSSNNASLASATPDFVDLHAAAAASKENLDFTSSASVGSGKLVVDCDFDENTRMQSPYAMQTNRIWNENEMIAARRSTSPSSVSESNDPPSSLDLQTPTVPTSSSSQQQQTPVVQQQQQMPHLQSPHVTAQVAGQQQQQQQQHAMSQNVLNNNNAMNAMQAVNSPNCKNSFFGAINNFAMANSFQQHSLQAQQQQQQQQSPLVNGIDSMLYGQGYSSTPTTPTSQTTTPQHQQQSQQQIAAVVPQQQQQVTAQQYNGTVNMFHDANATAMANMQQMPFAGATAASANIASVAPAVMYPAGTGMATNVNATGNNTNQQQQQQQSRANDMFGSNANSIVGSANAAAQYGGAAFTSSTHNIALTAAIVGGVSATGNLIDHNSPRHHQMQQATAQQQQQFHLTSPNNAGNSTAYNNLHMGSCAEAIMTTNQQQQQQSHNTTPTKDSPTKSNRSSSRYNQQQAQQQVQQQQQQQQQQLRNSHKSPQIVQHKSPGKSPRQMELLNKQLHQQQQQQAHGTLNEYPNMSAKPTKYDPLTHTLAGKPRQRAPRGTGAGSRGGRGRGRGRGRAANVANAIIPLPLSMNEYVSSDNLAGTPFEFSYEEELATPGMENLQSLRDRRRSFDCRNAQNAADAQKYRSPSYSAAACKVRAVNVAATAAANVSAPAPSAAATATSETSLVNCNNTLKATGSNLHAIVQPMLPGPVDMRTYNLGFEPQHSSASQEAYNNNLLGAFDSGTADQTLSEFDEDDEREFQSALRATGTASSLTTSKQQQHQQQQPQQTMPITPPTSVTTPLTSNLETVTPVVASNTGSSSLITTFIDTVQPTASTATALPLSSGGLNTNTSNLTTTITPTICASELVNDLQTSMETTSEDVSIDSDTTLTTKASLSDARNQLKLKIKGPLAYPDSYNSSTSITHASTVVQSNLGNVQTIAAASTVISASVSGSGTNSRRMRKKELLSLYVVQKDNHGDDSSCGLPPTDSSLMSNSLEVTRKTDSVCSEVDDYGSDLTAATNKRFKKNSSRELRSLDTALAVDNEIVATTGLGSSGTDGRRRSACSSGSTETNVKTAVSGSAGKRRGRSKTLEGAEDEPAPKLKIKIRGFGVESNVSATASMAGSSAETSYNSYEVSRRSVACPPKKRLTSNYTPTLEDLMRDSMNYRDQVMQEFGGDDEERTRRSSSNTVSNVGAMKSFADVNVLPPTKKAKSSKPKKDKKEKKRHKNREAAEDNSSLIYGSINSNSMTTTLVEQPISASPGDPPKLILRINKRKAESTATDTSLSSPATGMAINAAGAAVMEEPPAAPIRLKLARAAEGGGYVIGDKKRKKEKKHASILRQHTEELSHNTNSNASSILPTPLTNFDKFAEEANASASLNSPHVATYSHYMSHDPASLMVRTAGESDAAKDSSTPSPCLVIDSSKSNDIHDSSNTASSLHDPIAPCVADAMRSAAVTPISLQHGSMMAHAGGHCNENSNSQSSALSSHTHLSNSTSNSMMSAAHQSGASSNNHNNNSNSNNTNSSGSNNNNNNNSNNSGLLTLPKDCEVR